MVMTKGCTAGMQVPQRTHLLAGKIKQQVRSCDVEGCLLFFNFVESCNSEGLALILLGS